MYKFKLLKILFNKNSKLLIVQKSIKTQKKSLKTIIRILNISYIYVNLLLFLNIFKLSEKETKTNELFITF